MGKGFGRRKDIGMESPDSKPGMGNLGDGGGGGRRVDFLPWVCGNQTVSALLPTSAGVFTITPLNVGHIGLLFFLIIIFSRIVGNGKFRKEPQMIRELQCKHLTTVRFCFG